MSFEYDRSSPHHHETTGPVLLIRSLALFDFNRIDWLWKNINRRSTVCLRVDCSNSFRTAPILSVTGSDLDERRGETDLRPGSAPPIRFQQSCRLFPIAGRSFLNRL
jgi:hypothetical protein